MTIEGEWQEIMDVWHSIEDDTKWELANIWLDKEKHELKVMGAEIEDLAAKVIHLMRIIRESKGNIAEMDFHKKHLLSLIHHVKPTREWQREIQEELNELAQEIKVAREKGAIIIRDRQIRRQQTRQQPPPTHHQTHPPPVAVLPTHEKDVRQYSEISSATILQPNELDTIGRNPGSLDNIKKTRIDQIEGQSKAEQELYVSAAHQLEKIQTFPERFARAKAVISEFQGEYSKLIKAIFEKLKETPLSVSEREVDRIASSWFCYGIGERTFGFMEVTEKIPKSFLEENEQSSNEIINAIGKNIVIGNHLCRIDKYFFIPEPDKILEFTQLLLGVIPEMFRVLSTNEPWNIKKPSASVCRLIRPAYEEYGVNFACGKRQNKKAFGYGRKSDRLYLNEKAVEVLNHYPLPEAQRTLELEIQKIRTLSEYRKVITAAKIDVEAIRHRLRHFSESGEAEFMLSVLSDRQKSKEGLVGRIESLRTTSSNFLRETVTISANTGWSRKYKVNIGNESIEQMEIKIKEEITSLEREIGRYGEDIRQLKEARIVLQRDKKINDKTTLKNESETKLTAAKQKLKQIEHRKRDADTLSEILENDELGKLFVGKTFTMEKLLDEAQQAIEAHYSSIDYMHPDTKATYGKYVSLQEELKAAEARFKALG